MRRLLVLLLLHPLVGSGCASSGDLEEQAPASRISFAQLKAAPDSYKGQPVTLGGQVLSARRLKEGTRIEILQLPLTSSLHPTLDLIKSEGRFVAMRREFLDPATLPPGTFVTVVGELAGSMTLPLDETEYTAPLMEVRSLYVWSPRDDPPARIRPYPGPYWGPYWSPYWRPWPYW